MTQLCISDWTANPESQWNHAHAVYARPKATGRFTCKCLLCGKRWTALAGERDRSYAKHGETCERYQVRLRSMMTTRHEYSARASLRNSNMDCREIVGTFKAGVKCDARCQGAIGHDCECSCGGVNHGIGFGI